MGKSPAFLFYANDWLSSTRRAMMTPEQRASYIDLLCYQWNDDDCSLPDDDEALSMLSGMGERWLNGGCRLLRECFPPHPTQAGRVANPRLLEIRRERDEWSHKSSKGGKQSAKNRQPNGKGGSRVVQPPRQPKGNQEVNQPPTNGEPQPQPPCQPKGNTSSSSSSSSSIKVDHEEIVSLLNEKNNANGCATKGEDVGKATAIRLFKGVLPYADKDRPFLLAVARLLDEGLVAEDSVIDALEAVSRSTKPIQNPVGYFRKVLRENVAADCGDLDELLASVKGGAGA